MSCIRKVSWLCIGIGACGGSKAGEDAASDSAAATVAIQPAGPLRADSTGPVPMEMSLTIGGETHPITASGECGYEPNAAIFDKPAEMWIARAGSGNGPYLNLSVWRLKSGGPEQFNLGVLASGPDMHEISTVVGGPTKGSGTATITPSGTGGVIAIDGTDASGGAVKLTVNCARFDPIAEEGGR